MPDIFRKLNLKDQSQVVVLNAPENFKPELDTLQDKIVIRDARAVDEIEFMLGFGTKLSEVEQFAEIASQKTKGDAIVWFAYPKGSSKKYKCEFNRDTGWESLGKAGFEAVKQIAIDEDWSAIRFRRVEYIKKMTRGTLPAMSEAGKARTKKT
jgi:hypothetical protein